MAGAKKSPADYVTVGDGYADIELTRDTEIGGAKVKALRMREPTMRDQVAATKMSGNDLEIDIATFGNLCGVTPTDIEKLPSRDYKRVHAAFLALSD